MTTLKKLPRILALGALLGAGAGCTQLNQIANGMVPEDAFHRGVNAYSDPVVPTGFHTNDPQHVQFVDSQKDKEVALAALRAEFNRTRNLDLLNPYLHYRRLLSEQAGQDSTGNAARKLAIHDRKILDFVHSSQVQFWMVSRDGRLFPLDTSAKYLIAGRILDLMRNREDVLLRNIRQDAPLRIIMHEKLLQTTWTKECSFFKHHLGGYWSFGNADIHLDKADFWKGVLDRRDGYTPEIHETTHGLDSESIFLLNIANRGLPGLSEQDQNTFAEEHARIGKQLHHEAKQYIQEQQKCPSEESLDKARTSPALKIKIREDESSERKELNLHGLENRWEFLPVMVEKFYETPRALQALSAPIYDILKRFFQIDPANHYQDTADAVSSIPDSSTPDS
ncbi:MAG TPA: zinc-dependent peptidase [Coleofasciculaceae cyanobacterium]